MSIVEQDFKSNLPVAFVELPGNKYYIKITNTLCELYMEIYYGEKCGHYYFKCAISQKRVQYPDIKIKRSCILLPLLCDNGICINRESNLCVYTAIADDYTELDDSGKFVKKEIAHCNF